MNLGADCCYPAVPKGGKGVDNMLVLTRRAGERIFVGGDIIITIVDMAPGKVRVGIDAPKDVPIYREEVYERIQANRRAQASRFDEGIDAPGAVDGDRSEEDYPTGGRDDA